MTNRHDVERMGTQIEDELRNVARFPIHERVRDDVEQLDRLAGRSTPIPPPAYPRRSPNMPPYVEHHPEVDDVGRLSAEALAISYDNAAKQIEEMGTGLVFEIGESRKQALAMVQELERVEKEIMDAVDQCKAAAEVYRGQAKQLFEQIQNKSIVADKVRKMCQQLIELTGEVAGEK